MIIQFTKYLKEENPLKNMKIECFNEECLKV